ncbi:MAG: ExbD/TolR family protein [Phycisphaerae bacterium]|jgi:biopolymer transport protein ExbD
MRVRIFHHQSPVDKINVTPLIDVVMVLIVFYLIVGKLATDSAARVELPRATGAQQQDRGLVINLAVDDKGNQTLSFDGDEMALDQLTSELILRMPELANGTQSQPVSLRADRRLSFGDVEPVVNACKAAGVTSLKLITTREGGGQ